MNIYWYSIPFYNHIKDKIGWKDLFIKSNSPPTNEQVIVALEECHREEPDMWWDKCLETFRNITGPVLERNENELRMPVIMSKVNTSINIEKIRIIELR